MKTDTPLARRRLRMWLRLLRVTRSTETQLREFLRLTHDSTLPRFDVMAALYDSPGPMKMTELSKRLLVSNGNASTVVNRLEKDGLVRRIAEIQDRRVVLVDLTPEGCRQFEAQAKGHEAVVNDIFSALDSDDLDLLRALLHRAEASKKG